MTARRLTYGAGEVVSVGARGEVEDYRPILDFGHLDYEQAVVEIRKLRGELPARSLVLCTLDGVDRSRVTAALDELIERDERRKEGDR